MSEDAVFWAPRRYLREPIPEIFEAAGLLSAAVDAHLNGDEAQAQKLIVAADKPSIADFTESLWGKQNQEILRIREVPDAPPWLKGGKSRMPNATGRKELILRDGHLCRVCGIPVIRTEVRAAIRAVYPSALRWGDKNIEQHAAFQCMWLQYDHILPHSRGGDSSIENVMITCAPCNYGRWERTLEEVGLIDPRTLPIRTTSWDGLERFMKPTPQFTKSTKWGTRG